MLVTKSNRTTILPITNKNKLISLNNYFEKVFLAKNEISIKLNKDETIQNLLFTFDNSKENNKILSSYCNSLDFPIFSQWELQKFVNSDLLDREKNRIEQFFLNWKPKFKIYKNTNRENKNTKLSQLMILIAKNYFYSGYFNDKITEIFLSNKRYLNNEKLIRSYVERNILNYKYNRKPIIYTTSSMIKCEQRILGYSTPRIIKNHENKLYKHWLCFDYIDDSYEKQKINLPLAYEESYHKDFKQYNKSLSSNKYRKSKSDKIDLRTLKFTINNFGNKSLKKLNFKTLSFVNLSKNKTLKDNQNKIEVLFEREVQISLSKRTNRLTLTLSKEEEQNIESTHINENNTLGIDIGGSINNTLVDSSGKIISFKHLDKLLDRLEIIDKLKDETKEEKLAKGKLVSLISRINSYYINLIIKDYLTNCEKNGIKHLVFEKLDRWNVKWKREKDSKQKYNRIFQLLRQDGLVELFKKQCRNKNIFVHTIPSFYTSQMCSCCQKINKNNLKDNRRYICSCGYSCDRDINAAKNIKYILERFSKMLCKMNSYGEYESIKFISKEFTKKVLLTEKVKSFSLKSCI